MEMRAVGTHLWKTAIYSSGPDGGDVPDWRMTRCPLASWLHHRPAQAICCICRDPQHSREEEPASAAAGTHVLISADVGSWHDPDFRLEPSWLIPPAPDCLIRFPRNLFVCGCETNKGGRWSLTLTWAQHPPGYRNASRTEDGGSGDMVQVCAHHTFCSASFHLQFIALTFLLCRLLLGGYCKFGQLQLLFHLSLPSLVL